MSHAVKRSAIAVAVPLLLFVLIQGAILVYMQQPGNEDIGSWAINVMYLCLIGVGYLAGYIALYRLYFHGFLAGVLSALSVVLFFSHLLIPEQSRIIFTLLGGVLALLGVLLSSFDRKNRHRAGLPRRCSLP